MAYSKLREDIPFWSPLKRQRARNQKKSPISVMSIVTGGISFICLIVLAFLVLFMVKNEQKINTGYLTAFFIDFLVSITSFILSFAELKKSGFDYVTRISCFIVSLLPVACFVAFYVIGFIK